MITACAAVLMLAGCGGIPSNGQGSYVYDDGDRFDGQWRDSSPYYGTVTYRNGDVYTGQVIGGSRRNGQGRMVYKNGCSYEGQWKLGWKHGVGTYTCPTAYTQSGTYVEDELHDPNGLYRWADGNEYRGSYLYGKRLGAGRFKRQSDGQVSAQFVYGNAWLVSWPLPSGAPTAPPCATVPAGWQLTRGTCAAGQLDGPVVLISDNGYERFTATYAGGQPRGNATQERLLGTYAHRLTGPARGPGDFISGTLQGGDEGDGKAVWVAWYEGGFNGVERTTGRCTYSGGWEACEYKGTQRVDAAYLARLDRRQRQEQQAKADKAAREDQRRAEAAADRRASDNANRAEVMGALGAMSARNQQMAAERLANTQLLQLQAQAQRRQADEAAARQAAATRAAAETPRARAPVLTAQNLPQAAPTPAAQVLPAAPVGKAPAPPENKTYPFTTSHQFSSDYRTVGEARARESLAEMRGRDEPRRMGHALTWRVVKTEPTLCLEGGAVSGSSGKSSYFTCTQVVHYDGVSYLNVNDRSSSGGGASTR